MNLSRPGILTLILGVGGFLSLQGEEEEMIAWSWHYKNGKRSSESKAEKQPPAPGNWTEPYCIDVRHIEAGGIGYNQGYTSLEGSFFFPHGTSWVPFIDLRGHLFNNQQMAANAGFGLRYISSWVFGLNIYYDFRQTSHLKYQQASLGFEILGKVWDFRWNGYLPFGQKLSPFYHRRFYAFSGNRLEVERKREFALAGTQAEVGYHFKEYRHAKLYVAAGPYYYTGHHHHLWGGQLRATFKFLRHFCIEGNFSYDPTFKAVGQGQFRLTFPFGHKKKTPPYPHATNDRVLRERALQRVDRQEIVVLDEERSHTFAKDPRTGEAYTFRFANNQSSSELGTFELPAHTLSLLEATSQPGDILYLFSGDGTDQGMKSGFFLKKDQHLLGSGVSHTLKTQIGEIKIPAQTKETPCITNRGAPLREPLKNDTTNSIHGVSWQDFRSWIKKP